MQDLSLTIGVFLVALHLPAAVLRAGTPPRALALELRRLPVAARVLMVGAHPDDEDSALLAELALREGARTIYLSLTRGEGGQNRIGPETGTALGVLRTAELLAARRVDGAEQLLGPFVDFGYSKSAEETFARWDRQEVIGIIVQAIRQVQPDVVVSIFEGSTADGHGHHRACGLATREAFERAGDPRSFTEQLEAGLQPWRPARLAVRARRRGEEETAGVAHINTGRWDPVLQRSCLEVAMEGRSLHRSQDMGALRPKGNHRVIYRVDAGLALGDGATGSLLRDLPVELDAWVDARTGAAEREIREAVRSAAGLLRSARADHHPEHPERLAPTLARAAGSLRVALGHVEDPDPSGVRDRLADGIRRVEQAWARASGLHLDVLAAEGEVVPGDSLDVGVELFARGSAPVDLQSLEMLVAPGWEAESVESPPLPLVLAPASQLRVRWRVTVPATGEAVASTLPPWLRQPAGRFRYHFDGPLADLSPRAAAPVSVRARLRSGKIDVTHERELEHRQVDPGLGEVRRPLRVLPEIRIEASPPLSVIAAARSTPALATVTVRSSGAEREGQLFLVEGDPGEPLERIDWGIHRIGGARPLLSLRRPLPLEGIAGATSFHLRWEPLEGKRAPAGRFSHHSAVEIRYPHMEPRYLLVPALLDVRIVDVDVAPDVEIGYVPGSGDPLPEALKALGVSFQVLQEDALRFADLSGFDAIVVGIRALEVRPEVAASRERLWEYARRGGTVIVQYQKPRDDGPGRFVPLEGAVMTYPAPRVTDETAPVDLLRPEDPILSFPNGIGPQDFEGWVQERGLYFLERWPDELVPLLECRDRGEPPRRGGLLHGRLGEGHYVYCAYALFRQLPAGVPGAYRLLANLISLPRAPR